MEQNFFGKTFALQLISCFEVVRVFSSLLSEKPFTICICGSHFTYFCMFLMADYIKVTLLGNGKSSA